MKCEPRSFAFHARSRAAIVLMAVLFATGASTRHRAGNRVSGLRCASKSLRAIPAVRFETATRRPPEEARAESLRTSGGLRQMFVLEVLVRVTLGLLVVFAAVYSCIYGFLF